MKPKLTIYLVTILALGLLLSPSPSAQHNDQADKQSGTRSERQSTAAMGPEEFLKHAMMGNMAEIQLGELASERASSSQVKQFGQHMVEAHRKANEEVQSLAKQKGIKAPQKLDAKHQQTYDRLSKLQGAEFDRAYMVLMVQDHREDVEAFEYQAKNSRDKDVRRLASTQTPELRQHLQMATDARQQVGGRAE